jgi:ferredoxin
LLESVKVNANLCQGGGICASVCPTGAIRYVYPKATDTLRTVRTLLKTYNQAQGTRPIIAFIAETELAVLENEAANLLVVVVEELASVGMEVWLSAMAYGANQVLLINAAAMPAMVSEFLQQEIKTAEVILSGLAYNSPDESQKSIRLVTPDSLSQFCDAENNFALRKVASYVGSPEKRRTTLLAIDHLYQQNDSAPQIISLPEHASFGRIMVDGNACTLCMSCTSVCPAKAIDAGNDFPRLEFHELNCVQCGICAAACPEHAITLEPRLITDIEQRRRVVTLHEEVPFCCITCGKAFATKSLIDNMAKKLEGHYMFNSQRAKQRLMMCEDCRVIDVVQDEAAMHVI